MRKQAIFEYDVAPLSQETSIGDITAEEMAVSAYDSLYSSVSKRVEHARGDEEEKEVVFQELQLIVQELEGLIDQDEIKEDKKELIALRSLLRQFKKLMGRFPKQLAKAKKEEAELKEQSMPPPLPPPPIVPVQQMASIQQMIVRASTKIDDKELRQAVAEDYAEKICACLNHKHELTCNVKDGHLTFSNEDAPMIMVGVNDQCMVDEIAPLGKLASECPIHSGLFYQRYFKPIVEAIGHCFIDDKDALLVIGKSVLPDLPNKSQTNVVDVLSVQEKRPSHIGLSFQDDTWNWTGGSSTGRITTAQAQVQPQEQLSEKDFFNKRVKCIDPALETIYGKIGDVEQIIPRADCIELDVNFGRHIVRITDKQVEIIYGF